MPLFQSRKSKNERIFREIAVQAYQWLESQAIVPDQDVAVISSSIVGGFTAAADAVSANTLEQLWDKGNEAQATAIGRVFSLVTEAYLLNNFEVQQSMEFPREMKEEQAAILLTALAYERPDQITDINERIVAFRDEIDHFLGLDRQVRYAYWSKEEKGSGHRHLAMLVLLDCVAALKGERPLAVPLESFPIRDWGELLGLIESAGVDVGPIRGMDNTITTSLSITSGFEAANAILSELMQS